MSLVLLALAGLVALGTCSPHQTRHAYQQGDPVELKVSSLTSDTRPYSIDFCCFPFCQPTGGVRMEDEFFGELVAGVHIQNSPYKINMSEIMRVYFGNGRTSRHETPKQCGERNSWRIVLAPLMSLFGMIHQLQRGENHQWWWQSFFMGASPALHMFGFLIIENAPGFHGFWFLLLHGIWTLALCVSLGLVMGFLGLSSCFAFNLWFFGHIRPMVQTDGYEEEIGYLMVEERSGLSLQEVTQTADACSQQP